MLTNKEGLTIPIYEYTCRNKLCPLRDIIQEIYKPISDSDTPERCRADCKGTMKKLMSKNTFHLKGSGWYNK